MKLASAAADVKKHRAAVRFPWLHVLGPIAIGLLSTCLDLLPPYLGRIRQLYRPDCGSHLGRLRLVPQAGSYYAAVEAHVTT